MGEGEGKRIIEHTLLPATEARASFTHLGVMNTRAYTYQRGTLWDVMYNTYMCV